MPHLRLTTSLTHASLTSLNLSSHLTVFESVNLSNFFSFSPSQRLNFESAFASNLPHGFFFLFSFSPSQCLDLGFALCASLSASWLHQVLILFFWFCFWLLDSLSFIWSFSHTLSLSLSLSLSASSQILRSYSWLYLRFSIPWIHW